MGMGCHWSPWLRLKLKVVVVKVVEEWEVVRFERGSSRGK